MKYVSSAPWVFVSVAILLAGMSFAFTSGYWLAKMRTEPLEQSTDVVSSETPEPLPEVVGKDELAVRWYTTKEVSEYPKNTEFYAPFIDAAKTNNGDYPSVITVPTFVLGVINGGEYDGYTLREHVRTTTYTASPDPTTNESFYTLEKEIPGAGPRVVLLKNIYSVATDYFPYVDPETAVTSVPDEDVAAFVDPKNAWSSGASYAVSGDSIPDFVVANHEKGSHGGYTFVSLGGRVDYPNALTLKDYPVVDTLPDGRSIRIFTWASSTDSFMGMQNAFFTIRPDNHVVWYDHDLSFWNAKPLQSGTPAFTVYGAPLTSSYFKSEIGGCGAKAITNVVETSSIPGLKIIGYVTGDQAAAVYGANYADTVFDGDFQGWQYVHSEGTRTDFAKLYPYLYYKDTFGRLIQFQNADVVPAAECGKPVIYLYPPKTMDVTVNLAPQGGFTKSEPAYENGWNVTASPDGTLVNKADGKTYPYLFWEGRGGMYVSPDKYWVVKQSDVKTFLESTLATLGLNAKETADFMEFWYPKMQSSPYYKIGFYGTSVMNQIAPMSLSAKPDTVIRVLMDYSELPNAEPSNPPQLGKTPERKGFTVLEWGGVLR